MLNSLYVWELTDLDKQILDSAIWIVDNKVSIRQTAKEFYISKSKLQRQLSDKLKKLSYELYCCVRNQLLENKKKYFTQYYL